MILAGVNEPGCLCPTSTRYPFCRSGRLFYWIPSATRARFPFPPPEGKTGPNCGDAREQPSRL